MYNLLVDKEITSSKNDVFNRNQIAKSVAESIINKTKDAHPCFTIGINAKWGEGKTSVLNMIKEHLQNQANVVIIDFNPWMFRDSESILMEFFNSIDGEKISAKFVKALKEYGPIVTLGVSRILDLHLPGAGVVLDKSVSSFIDRLPNFNENVIQRKAQLNKELKTAKKHLLIFVDDVDRLDKDEIHCLFKLIKQTADFDNTIFVVAMDKDVVAHSLCSRYENGNELSGYNFLEKIIQLQLYLPQFDRKQLTLYFDNHYNELVGALSPDKNKERDLIEAQEAIHKYVMPMLSSPREIIQYINILSYTLPPLLNEVNLSDICLLESLKVIAPQAYNMIRAHRHLFVGERYDVHFMLIEYKTDEERQAKIKAERKELMELFLKNTCPSLRYNLSTIIGTLLSGYFFDNSLGHQLEDQKRLCSKVYFDRYFQYETPSDTIAEKTIDEMIVNIQSVTPETLVDDFNSLVSQYGVDELKRVIFQIVRAQLQKGITNDGLRNICIALALMPDNNDRRFFTERDSNKWEFSIVNILSQIIDTRIGDKIGNDYATIFSTINDIIDRVSTLFGVFFIVECYRKRFSSGKANVTKLVYKQAKKYVKETSSTDFFHLGQLCLETLCKCWKATNEREYIAFTQSYIENPASDIVNLVHTFIYNGEVKYCPMFESLFDPNLVYKRLVSECEKDQSLKTDKDISVFMHSYETK